MCYRELVVAILQQAVDDYIWSSKINRYKAEKCPDERYYNYYYDINNEDRKLKNRDIFKFKLSMFKDVKNFFTSDWGDLCCSAIFGLNCDGKQIYNQLLKRYGANSIIKDLYESCDEDIFI